MNSLVMVMLLTQAPAQNVVLVAIDGLRPAEVFTGGQRSLMHDVENEAGLVERFWRESPDERRRALMPFLWEHVAVEGQIFGNAARGSPMKVTNERRCSYPGYNEMLTGVADPRIEGNAHPANPNVTVFEWLSRQPGFLGRVQAFATWETFLRIFNVERSGLDVRAGWNPPFAQDLARTSAKDTLDALYRTTTPVFGGNALDAITWAAQKESLRTNRPRLLFFGLGETDEWMHAGRYDLALESVRRADATIADLWNTLQSMPEYRGTTTMIITTDHGRGSGAADWQHHGASIQGADDIWVAAIGPGVPSLGERTNTGLITQTQLASTIAELLGHDWSIHSPNAGKALPLKVRLSSRRP